MGFDGCIGGLAGDMPDLGEFVEALLSARQKLRETFMALHHKLLSDSVTTRPADETLAQKSGRFRFWPIRTRRVVSCFLSSVVMPTVAFP